MAFNKTTVDPVRAPQNIFMFTKKCDCCGLRGKTFRVPLDAYDDSGICKLNGNKRSVFVFVCNFHGWENHLNFYAICDPQAVQYLRGLSTKVPDEFFKREIEKRQRTFELKQEISKLQQELSEFKVD